MSKNSRQILIVLLTLYTFLVVYASQRSEILQDFTHSSATVKSQISQQVQLSNGFIDQMSLLGGEFFTNNSGARSYLRKYLKQDPSGDFFSMDSIKNSVYSGTAGNLTGIGKIDSSPEQSENIDLALLYTPHFKSYYDSLHGIAWVYYTGKDSIVMMYPWVSSSDFKFSPELFTVPFYRIGMPDTNPAGIRRWTQPYLDVAGKGLMVTLSKPVYKMESIRGVVSVDITLQTLSSMMNPKYHSFMVDNDGNMLASNDTPSLLGEKILSLEDYRGKEQAQALQALTKNNSDVLKTIGSNYVYLSSIDNCPWILVNELSFGDVFLKSAFSGAPVLLIGFLLLLSSNANERRKKIEQTLTATVLELEESRRQLRYAASIDFLTGTLNRRSMTERLHEEISRFERYNTSFSLVMGDIDHFKSFNDNYGHAAGDAALKHIVAIITSSIRGSDLLCRWGGEEFLIMLPDTAHGEAVAAAEKLRTAISASRFEFEGIKDIRITMSFGVSEYTHEKSLDQNIIQADDALYQAKENGRNRVVGFNDMN